MDRDRERKGKEDRKEVVYQRDAGICGICGNFVPWDEADMDHKIPGTDSNPQRAGIPWKICGFSTGSHVTR